MNASTAVVELEEGGFMRSLISTSAVAALLWISLGSAGPAAAQEKRRFDFPDLAAIRNVSDPQLSPEGDWVAYVVRTANVDKDLIAGDIWMTRWDGSRTIQLTHTEKSESTPRFSPDGRYLSFLATRGEGDEKPKSQVWVLDRSGGEARQLTSFAGGVSDYVWSPDGSKLAVIASDPDPEDDADEDATPKPIVIDRYQFKRDRVGYLRHFRSHLYLFDVETEASDLLRPGDYDEALPSFSPDGTHIAFSSKRGPDPDRHDNWDIYLIEARAGASPRKLTDHEGADNDPSWGSPAAFSPDGSRIAYLRGSPPENRFYDYDMPKLTVMSLEGGAPQPLLPNLDRWVSSPTWSADGRFLYFLLEDDRNQVVARVAAEGGAVERLGETPGVTRDLSVGPDGRVAATATSPHAPAEIVAVEGDRLRPLTGHNAELLARVELGDVEGIEVESRDGTIVHGLLVKPPGFEPGRRYPTIAYIHGGPVSQDGFEFDYIWQILAANGYVVVAPNYRGSSGRGQAYSLAIRSDWGHLEVQDVLATVDHVVAQGIADPERLGIGGWSYGGMTTNYTIASDPRFKAAVSGAGISNMLAGYGTDQYVRQYEQEVGLPWVDIAPYLHISYPFYHADKIRTPTLFLCGEKDFNVPLINSEQMYQALVSLGVETELVIYPGQYHSLSKPSYQRDRLERYVSWFDRFLKPGTTN